MERNKCFYRKIKNKSTVKLEAVLPKDDEMEGDGMLVSLQLMLNVETITVSEMDKEQLHRIVSESLPNLTQKNHHHLCRSRGYWRSNRGFFDQMFSKIQ